MLHVGDAVLTEFLKWSVECLWFWMSPGSFRVIRDLDSKHRKL